MAYKEGDLKKYLSMIVAALIVVAVVVGYFIYSLVYTDVEEPLLFVETADGVIPGEGMVPDGPPSVPPPTTPPPTE